MLKKILLPLVTLFFSASAFSQNVPFAPENKIKPLSKATLESVFKQLVAETTKLDSDCELTAIGLYGSLVKGRDCHGRWPPPEYSNTKRTLTYKPAVFTIVNDDFASPEFEFSFGFDFLKSYYRPPFGWGWRNAFEIHKTRSGNIKCILALHSGKYFCRLDAYKYEKGYLEETFDDPVLTFQFQQKLLNEIQNVLNTDNGVDPSAPDVDSSLTFTKIPTGTQKSLKEYFAKVTSETVMLNDSCPIGAEGLYGTLVPRYECETSADFSSVRTSRSLLHEPTWFAVTNDSWGSPSFDFSFGFLYAFIVFNNYPSSETGYVFSQHRIEGKSKGSISCTMNMASEPYTHVCKFLSFSFTGSKFYPYVFKDGEDKLFAFKQTLLMDIQTILNKRDDESIYYSDGASLCRFENGAHLKENFPQEWERWSRDNNNFRYYESTKGVFYKNTPNLPYTGICPHYAALANDKAIQAAMIMINSILLDDDDE